MSWVIGSIVPFDVSLLMSSQGQWAGPAPSLQLPWSGPFPPVAVIGRTLNTSEAGWLVAWQRGPHIPQLEI